MCWYVPRVVLSSYQLKVHCCCTSRSDHGSWSSQVLLVELWRWNLFLQAATVALFLAVWLRAGKMRDCQVCVILAISTGMKMKEYRWREDSHREELATCGGDTHRGHEQECLETIIKLTGQPMGRSNAMSANREGPLRHLWLGWLLHHVPWRDCEWDAGTIGNYHGIDKIILEKIQRRYEGKIDILEDILKELWRLQRASG